MRHLFSVYYTTGSFIELLIYVNITYSRYQCIALTLIGGTNSALLRNRKCVTVRNVICIMQVLAKKNTSTGYLRNKWMGPRSSGSIVWTVLINSLRNLLLHDKCSIRAVERPCPVADKTSWMRKTPKCYETLKGFNSSSMVTRRINSWQCPNNQCSQQMENVRRT